MNELEGFRELEIKNLTKLRFVCYMFLILLNLGIIIFFLYSFYSVYIERNIDVNFLPYIAPTIFPIQCILLVALGPLVFILHTRFQYAIKEIKGLNEEYLQRYYEYVNSIERAFTGIPPYIFTQKGMIVIKNFSHELYPPNSIEKLTISIIKRGGLARNSIKIYQQNKVKNTLTFIGFQTSRLEFIKKNVKLENPYVIIEEITNNTW